MKSIRMLVPFAPAARSDTTAGAGAGNAGVGEPGSS